MATSSGGAVTKGLDILVYVVTNEKKKKKGCTLTMEAETIDVSNKNDFGWASTIGGAKSWSVSCDGQFIANDEGQKALMDAFVAGTEVQVEMKNTAESIYFSGKAAITSLEVDAQFDDVATMTIELQGIGALKTSKSS